VDTRVGDRKRGKRRAMKKGRRPRKRRSEGELEKAEQNSHSRVEKGGRNERE
jgi:hypothetical protein